MKSLRKGQEFLRTVFSGDAPEDVVAARRAHCDACPSKEVDGAAAYCGACGCPRNVVSELGRKLRFRGLRCPLGRFGALT